MAQFLFVILRRNARQGFYTLRSLVDDKIVCLGKRFPFRLLLPCIFVLEDRVQSWMIVPTGEMHCLGGVLIFLENKIMRHRVLITLQELGVVPE